MEAFLFGFTVGFVPSVLFFILWREAACDCRLKQQRADRYEQSSDCKAKTISGLQKRLSDIAAIAADPD